MPSAPCRSPSLEWPRSHRALSETEATRRAATCDGAATRRGGGRPIVASVSMTSPLPQKAADTTAEQPWPVRVLSLKISDYVDRMSQLWVEGQVVQFNPRGGTAFLTLRDHDRDMSQSVSVPMNARNGMAVPLAQGARVVLQAKPTFWTKRGTLQLEARQIRPVGLGDLLARVEIR